MTLDELKAHIESRYKWLPGLAVGGCQTGEAYLTFRVAASNESLACQGVLEEFNRYAANCAPNAILYWRTLPESMKDTASRKIAVAMRLCLSAKPKIFKTTRDYLAAQRRGKAA